MARVITSKAKIKEILEHQVEDVIVKNHLEKQLLSGKHLRVKLGIDPTRPDLHIGHAVVLRKLRAFQELGHKVILLVGSFTGMIGDPEGKASVRKKLSASDVKKNFASYKRQAAKIIDINKTEIVYNDKWLSKLKLEQTLELASSFTVSQMLERDMYQERIKKGLPINLIEFIYPLMQGYDSVEIKADIEIGGTDQLFNILAGRTVQKHFGMPEQDVLTCPLLVGLDGHKKMSKSEDNYISLDNTEHDMYGKIMSIPDHIIPHYFKLATDSTEKEVQDITRELERSKVNPRDVKMKLADIIVSMYHSKAKARGAEEQFKNIFQKKGEPEAIPNFEIAMPSQVSIIDVVTSAFGISKSDVRRLIDQQGLRKNRMLVQNINEIVKDGDILQKGKRHFIKIQKK